MEISKVNPFHLAIPVKNLKACRDFYGEIMGCTEGRSSEQWVDFNFFGHQLVIHEVRKELEENEKARKAAEKQKREEEKENERKRKMKEEKGKKVKR